MDAFTSRKCSRRDFLKNTIRLCCLGGLAAVFPRTLGASPRKPENKSELPKAEEADDAAEAATDFEPAYLELHRSGELKRRAEELLAIMKNCRLCPRQCGVNRLEGEEGVCGAPGATLMVSSSHPHFGEEKPLVGTGGSGTIFMTHCNLRCVFCQNFTISHLGRGSKTNVDKLASMMLELQNSRCHNINIVTPTHYSALILQAIDVAAGKGLRLPIVYNTSGWERLEILGFLDGVVDIYLPDFKYWDSEKAAKYSSGAASYPEITKKAILEMDRQVGVAKPSNDGILERGLIIRHLVMPNEVAGSERIMQWIADNLPKNTYVNIMAQYTPIFQAYDYPQISRRITETEYNQVVQKAKDVGLTNLDVRGYSWL